VAARFVTAELEIRGSTADWEAAARALARLAAGAEAELPPEADAIDHAIVRRAVAVLQGEEPIGARAWHQEQGIASDAEMEFLDRFVGAARGDAGARAELDSALADEGPIGQVLRRVLAGERGVDVLDDLDASPTRLVARILGALSAR
jgi:hypothetical protein